MKSTVAAYLPLKTHHILFEDTGLFYVVRIQHLAEVVGYCFHLYLRRCDCKHIFETVEIYSLCTRHKNAARSHTQHSKKVRHLAHKIEPACCETQAGARPLCNVHVNVYM